MAADEAVVFVDAVHLTHQVRAAGCWRRRALRSRSNKRPAAKA
jgi:hypothetical protein